MNKALCSLSYKHCSLNIYQQIIVSLEIGRIIQVYENKAIWEQLSLVKVQNNEGNLQITKQKGMCCSGGQHLLYGPVILRGKRWIIFQGRALNKGRNNVSGNVGLRK